ncbi:MAG TPA: lactonase family protein, partial [Chthonomonadales bacterium]|nr:lactonase family protein [Chthonomonadales bacterium]
MVANYGSGSVAALPISTDGSLGDPTGFDQHHGAGINPSRQEGPHAHSILPDPTGRYALAADLGLDKIFIYALDPKHGRISAADPATAEVRAGSGPRHMAFSPNRRFVYVISEMGSLITAFRYEPGRLTYLQEISTLPPGYNGENTGAEIAAHPSGRFLYASNRGDNSIALFHLDQHSGRIVFVSAFSSGGRTPRNFAIDPTGQYLLAANQDSNSVVVFRIDQKNGSLAPVGSPTTVSSPVCIAFSPRRIAHQ